MLADEFERVFEHGHHAKAEQINFDDAHVGAIFFVPLDDDAIGHGGRLERNDGIELSLADDHAAGMLPEMARQILHGDSRVPGICAGADVADRNRRRETGGRAYRPASLYSHVRNELREAVERFIVEAQRLADFARRRPSAIGDDVRSHGRAELAVALVDVLNDALALIAAGQIEIDVRPLAAFFGEKSFEEQFHPDGIDGGDSERITDRAVRGRAAALHQDVLARGKTGRCPRR